MADYIDVPSKDGSGWIYAVVENYVAGENYAD